ncbi:nuclear pore complex protein NUP54-like isoform X3 [Triticum dicoccoides]|uniref:nuclear pore complex protein NUP54-like isoform X3 n=1 Tax=Triticum dicoccoides TaxID=85692 RepID=UPI0018901E46|nr:nuclear pore complex protein NUP54-like isoform X3 [Triticum dicoccoides]
MFGTSNSPSLFGTPSSAPSFGTPSTTPAFGTPSSTPAFGAPSSTPAFGVPSSTPAFGAPSSTPSFWTPTSSPTFGTPSSTPAFGALPSSSPSPFGFQQQVTPSPSPFGFGGGAGGQITTQMAPVAPLPLSPSDRDIQAMVDAYKEDPGNPRYAFRHLLFSVTDPSQRVKPVAASDIMWAEAMGKLECMDNADRERLWPQLVQGFKDLSCRLKLQDEVLVSDTERLSMTHSNVKKLQRHFQADTYPWIQRLKHQELVIERRLLRIMRIVEALENRGFRVPLMKEEADLYERLVAIIKQIKGTGGDLSKRAYNLLSTSRVLASAGCASGPIYIPSSTKVDKQNVTELLEALQQQTEAVAKLGNVLKRDTRDVEIVLSEDTDMEEDSSGRRAFKM